MGYWANGIVDHMESPAAYVSIGDSMSIDLYPFLELSQADPGVSNNVGASSLLYRNNASLWPEFQRQDLCTSHPDIRYFCLAEEGATTFDFLDPDVLKLLNGHQKAPMIVTITLGGNDILQLINRPENQLSADFDNLFERYDRFIDLVAKMLPRAICILSSIYDPTDGSGVLPGHDSFKERLVWLHRMNEHIEICSRGINALFADVHKHFLGHGLSAPADQRWYWAPNPIEPSARGASEIRRLWLDALRS